MNPRYSPAELAGALGLFPPTAEQAAVIAAPPGPLVVIAGAGAGKTETMAARVVWLVANGYAEPGQVLGLTFTRKAAGEFADAVLTKLAKAAASEVEAAGLRRELALPNADFGEALERVLRVLPRIMLGTMDGFFAKVIRGFQYELGLTGGRFDLLEGARAAASALLGPKKTDRIGSANR